MHRSMTLKQRITLGLAAFLLALAVQIFLSFYQSGTVMQRLDDQMGQFNAISRFQGGVERGLTVLGDYRGSTATPTPCSAGWTARFPPPTPGCGASTAASRP